MIDRKGSSPHNCCITLIYSSALSKQFILKKSLELGRPAARSNWISLFMLGVEFLSDFIFPLII